MLREMRLFLTRLLAAGAGMASCVWSAGQDSSGSGTAIEQWAHGAWRFPEFVRTYPAWGVCYPKISHN